jgi:tellurite resistance protein TerC
LNAYVHIVVLGKHGKFGMLAEGLDWLVFLGAAVGCLLLDNVFLRTSNLKYNEACKLVGFWITVGLGFSVYVFVSRGRDPGIAYISGYILELMLSMDNLFFFQAIFKLYRTPHDQRDKALFFGIAFAAFLRFIFFLVGTELFAWTKAVRYVFGAVILYSAYVVAFEASEPDIDQQGAPSAAGSENPVMKVLERFVPFVAHYGAAGEFVIKETSGKKKATMLLMVVLFLGLVDVIIAVDAVAAKISEYNDIFVNFSSSFFAMLCLRALYFVIEYLSDMFTLLKYGLALILCYVGTRLILESFVIIPEIVSMLVIISCFLGSIAASQVHNSYNTVRTRSSSVELEELPPYTEMTKTDTSSNSINSQSQTA